MRRTRAIALAAFVLLAAAAPSFAGPKAEFADTVYSAGRVEHGAEFTHDFLIRNTGDAPLAITEVRASCGCTATDYDATIPPGGQGKIRAKLKTHELPPGKGSKTITVGTNAAGAERVILRLDFDLFNPLEFLPKAHVYMFAAEGQDKVETVLVRPNNAGMKITGVTSSNPAITVSLAPAKPAGKTAEGLASMLLPKQGDFWLTVTLKKGTAAGRQSAEVTVRTSDPSYPEGKLRIDAVVRERTAEQASTADKTS